MAGEALEDKLLDNAAWVDGNKYLNSIKGAFTVFMPFTIVGSFGSLLNTVICSKTTGLAAIWPAAAELFPAFSALNFCCLSFMTIPIFVVETRLGLILRDVRVYKVSALRLVVAPLATLLVLWLMPVGLVPTYIKMVILITFSTPVDAMCAMLSQRYGANYECGAGIVSLPTLLSLGTMPLVLGLGMAVL